MTPNEGQDAGVRHIRFVCASCREPLDVDCGENDLKYGERHECWGDRATFVGFVDESGIRITDERIELEVIDE